MLYLILHMLYAYTGSLKITPYLCCMHTTALVTHFVKGEILCEGETLGGELFFKMSHEVYNYGEG